MCTTQLASLQGNAISTTKAKVMLMEIGFVSPARNTVEAFFDFMGSLNNGDYWHKKADFENLVNEAKKSGTFYTLVVPGKQGKQKSIGTHVIYPPVSNLDNHYFVRR